MQKGEGCRRLEKRRHVKEAGNCAEVGPGRSAQAGRPGLFWGPVASPFDLAAIQAIYSPRVKSHEKNSFRHRPPRSREERDTISERRGSS
jgi:hypothetical protein